VHGPRILFLDEPFEGIDAVTNRTIKDILLSLQQRGVTVRRLAALPWPGYVPLF
jgi:ABC-2 type transport system ATP-binding protein